MTLILKPQTLAKIKPSDQTVTLVDRSGLTFRCTPNGARTWSLRYRIGRHQRRVTFGAYPDLSLADARQKVRDAKKQLSDGIDPAEVKEQRREADTVADVAKLYIEKYAKPKKKSWRDDQRMLKHQVLPQWKHRPMTAVTRKDVRVLLRGIVERGAPILANRVHALLSMLFTFAIDQDIVETNPVRDVGKPSEERIRERVLSEDEIRTFWQTTETLSAPLQALWKIRLLTAKRPGEVANMRWEDVDLESGWWVNPGQFEKNGVTHRVPLSAPVVGLLAGQYAAADADDMYVFEGHRGARQRRATFALPDFQPKDLRKTAATYLSKHGIADATIDAVLNHKKTGIIRVYNLHQYDVEKRIALDLWARTLTGIIGQKDSNVIAFARG